MSTTSTAQNGGVLNGASPASLPISPPPLSSSSSSSLSSSSSSSLSSSSSPSLCITVRESKIEMTELVNHLHTDSDGFLRLGHLLKLIDTAAVMSAEKLAMTTCVTCAVDDLMFDSSGENSEVKAGSILVIIASVNAVYNTSMEIGVRVEVENFHNSLRSLVCKAYLVFVPQTKGHKLRTLVAETDTEVRRMQLANERKKIRVAVKGLVDRVVAAEARSSLPDPTISTISSSSSADCINGSSSSNSGCVNSSYNYNNSSNYNATAPTSITSTTIEGNKNSNDKGDEAEHEEDQYVSRAGPKMQSVQLVLPPHANHMHNTFGGQVMEWMVEACIIAAVRHVKQKVRIESIDNVYFVAPSVVGDRIYVKAHVNRSFGGTMEVGVRAESVSSSGGSPVLICKAFVVITLDSSTATTTFKSVASVAPNLATTKEDASSRVPSSKTEMIDIPDVTPTTADEIKRWRAAKGRQQVRLERRALVEAGSSKLSWSWSDTVTPREFRFKNISSLLRMATVSKKFWQIISKNDFSKLELKEIQHEVTAVKLSAAIEAPAKSAFHFLKDLSNRKLWDRTFTDAEIRVSVDEEDDIIWQAMGDRDFCLLRSWTSNAPLESSSTASATSTTSSNASNPNLKRYVIASHSVIHDSTPPNVRGFTRSEVDSSGFIIEPMRLADGTFSADDSKCSLTYIAQIGANALRLVIGELYANRAASSSSSSSSETTASTSIASVAQPPIMASFAALNDVLTARYKAESNSGSASSSSS